MKTNPPNSRRDFLNTLVVGAAVSGISVIANPLQASIPTFEVRSKTSPDAWFDKIKGTHRAVFDGSAAYNNFPVIWNWAFYLTNNETGSQDDDMTGVTVLRHEAFPLALKDSVWEKYHLGENFKIEDSKTKTPSIRNMVYEPQDGDLPMPGIDGIKALQDRGAMFCVCDLALKVYSSFVANSMSLDATQVYNEWVDGVLPGIEIVPSGVWALGRAQEHKCAYIYAGG